MLEFKLFKEIYLFVSILLSASLWHENGGSTPVFLPYCEMPMPLNNQCTALTLEEFNLAVNSCFICIYI